MSKSLLIAAAVASIASLAHAEAQRTQYTTENRFPKPGQLETGAQVGYSENDGTMEVGDIEAMAFTPYARFGLLDNLTASAKLPLVSEDADLGGSEFGLGAVEIGLQMRAYQAVLTYPFVIPHVEFQIDTADDSLRSSAANVFTTVGISFGTVVEDSVTFVADGRYKLYQDKDNVAEGALSVLWSLSNQFAWIGEVKVSNYDTGDGGTPVNFLGGFSYDWTRQVSTSFHAGVGTDESPEDVVAIAKLAYTW